MGVEQSARKNLPAFRRVVRDADSFSTSSAKLAKREDRGNARKKTEQVAHWAPHAAAFGITGFVADEHGAWLRRR